MIKQLFSLSMIILIFECCGKKDEPKTYATESFPQKVILAVDNPNDPLFYDYLSWAGVDVLRVKVERTDKGVEVLYNSSHARECVWIAHLEGNLIYFQLASDTGVYLKAGINRVGGEYYLIANSGKASNGAHLFDRHTIEIQNGTRVTTIESYLYPKHYFSREGVVAQGNAVKLNMHAKAEDAVKVRWYSRIF